MQVLKNKLFDGRFKEHNLLSLSILDQYEYMYKDMYVYEYMYKNI